MPRRLMRTHEFLAINLFNAVALLLIFNLALAGIYFMVDRFRPPTLSIDPRVVRDRARNAELHAYSTLSPDEVDVLLDEQESFMNIGFLYEPWVGFRSPEFHGKYLNTDSHGFRQTRKPSRSSERPIKIFVFGGSTTFGYGVPDDSTIPSYIQAIIEDKSPQTSAVVSNYGQGYYYSSQEMQLFLSLIKKGAIPQYAVFIDGLNEIGLRIHGKRLGYDEPWFAWEVKDLWDAKRGAIPSSRSPQALLPGGTASVAQPTLLDRIPMIRFAKSLSARFFSQSDSKLDVEDDAKRKSESSEPDSDTESMIDNIVSVYTANLTILDAICREYRVNCYFVWQPVPWYKYDRKLLRDPSIQLSLIWEKVYSAMEAVRRENFLYLGNMLEASSQKGFVDQLHYNERVNEQIARRISELLLSHQD